MYIQRINTHFRNNLGFFCVELDGTYNNQQAWKG